MHCNKLAVITSDWTLNIENGRRQAERLTSTLLKIANPLTAYVSVMLAQETHQKMR